MKNTGIMLGCIEPPNYWKELKPTEFPPGNLAARCWSHKLIESFLVLRSKAVLKKTGEEWIHLSISRADRLPSWQELAKVRDEFLGEFREAYHLIPSKRDAVNIHQYCMHLWCPMDGVSRVANLQDLEWEYAI